MQLVYSEKKIHNHNIVLLSVLESKKSKTKSIYIYFSDIELDVSNIKIVEVQQSDGYKFTQSFDNDYRTWITVQKEGKTAWIEYSLDYKQYIHQVTYYNIFFTNWNSSKKSPCTENGAAVFEDCILKRDDIAVEVLDGVQEKKCGEIRLSTGLAQQDQQYTVPCNAYGDTIKISSSKKFDIADFVVVGNGK